MPNMTPAIESLLAEQKVLLARRNHPAANNGVYQRWAYPVVTREHTPL
ncbi:MAG: glycosidase, partial [Moraxellaceae bacterium]